MSLYLSDWFDGPSDFFNFGDSSWDPHVFCIKENGVVKITTSFFNVKDLKDFVETLGDDLGHRFVHRLDLVNSYLIDLMHVDSYLTSQFTDSYSKNNFNIEKTAEDLSYLFISFLLDFEFWKKWDILDVITNLIFYGTVNDPHSIFLIIPPMCDWDDSNFWSSDLF